MKLDSAALAHWSLFIKSIIDEEARSDEDSKTAALLRFSGGLGWRLVNPDTAQQETGNVRSVGNDPELFAEVMQTQAAIHSDAIEAAIIEWSRTRNRPRFSGEDHFYFLDRLQLASQFLEWAKQGGEPLRIIDLYGPAPDQNDWSKFLIWLLLRVWDAHGDFYLECLAEEERKNVERGPCAEGD